MLIENKKHKYITFHDYTSSFGFSVRVPFYDSENQIRTKKSGVGDWFSVAKYKTKKDAFMAAIKHRDKMLKRNKCVRLLYVRSGTPITKSTRNTCGIIGIAFVERYKNNNYYCAYTAIYKDRFNVRRKRYFSIDKFGECEAFKKACEVRFKYSGTLYIENEYSLPCLPDQKYIINE